MLLMNIVFQSCCFIQCFFKFFGEFDFIVVLFKLFNLIRKSLSILVVLLFLLLSFIHELLLHLINLNLSFFSSNNRFSVGRLDTLNHGIVSLSLLFRFLFLIFELILDKFKLLFYNSFLFCPSSFTLFEHLLSFLKLILHFCRICLML